MRCDISLLLLLSTIASVTSQWSSSSTTCNASEAAGIDQCQSAGSGFTFDQAKSKSCPQSSVDVDPSSWSCDQWKCHIYCSNPSRPQARKSCTNCEEVEVSEGCWEERQQRCSEIKELLDGCDVLCSTAAIHHGWAVMWIGVVVVMALGSIS